MKRLPIGLPLLFCWSSIVALVLFAVPVVFAVEAPDLILHNGKIVTVDAKDSLASAIAIAGEKISAVGTDADVLALQGEKTKLVDLAGQMVLPGLIDSHVHPVGAAMFEFDHEVPEMETIADVLKYISERAKVVPVGESIWVSQVFITRLREQRFPTRAELDAAAPEHPVVFRTGPDAALNSLALEKSGIDSDFQVVGAGFLERDPKTGELNGILRGCTRYIKSQAASTKEPSDNDRLERLAKLFADYNSVGLTCVSDRYASESSINLYRQLRQSKQLTVRMMMEHGVGTDGDLEKIKAKIHAIGQHPLHRPDPMLRIIGIKTMLDGGMLTGSAYMLEPWGISDIYSIRDPRYRGVRFIEDDRLEELVSAAVAAKLQYTAHAVGDGATAALIAAYEKVDQTQPIAATRPCLTHGNFLTADAIQRMKKLGIVADVQPAWLYLDARTLKAQFGDARLRYFQPLKTLFANGVVAGGGSDHMQKIGSLRSINPYNPFLGIGTAVTRTAKWFEGQLHPEESLSRERAIRFYTMNNAHLLFMEDQIGSLEPGKLADLVVVDRDLLTCPAEEIRDTKVRQTYLNGKLIYEGK
jgi:predicted amidohydrolase YtcJ